jgi:hypothetical protein
MRHVLAEWSSTFAARLRETDSSLRARQVCRSRKAERRRVGVRRDRTADVATIQQHHGQDCSGSDLLRAVVQHRRRLRFRGVGDETASQGCWPHPRFLQAKLRLGAWPLGHSGYPESCEQRQIGLVRFEQRRGAHQEGQGSEVGYRSLSIAQASQIARRTRMGASKVEAWSRLYLTKAMDRHDKK